jgi:hypothetical protein
LKKLIFASILFFGLVFGVIVSSESSIHMADEVLPWGQEEV